MYCDFVGVCSPITLKSQYLIYNPILQANGFLFIFFLYVFLIHTHYEKVKTIFNKYAICRWTGYPCRMQQGGQKRLHQFESNQL